MNEIIIGEDYNGQPIIYETPIADGLILATLGKLLATTLVSFGMKALYELVNSKEFALRYPGGKLKCMYKLVKKVFADDETNEKKQGCDISLSLDNFFD